MTVYQKKDIFLYIKEKIKIKVYKMKELKSQKNNKKYGESLYINLDENEKKIFSELMIKENRNKSNLASYIIKEYLKEYQSKQAEDTKKVL